MSYCEAFLNSCTGCASENGTDKISDKYNICRANNSIYEEFIKASSMLSLNPNLGLEMQN